MFLSYVSEEAIEIIGLLPKRKRARIEKPIVEDLQNEKEEAVVESERKFQCRNSMDYI